MGKHKKNKKETEENGEVADTSFEKDSNHKDHKKKMKRKETEISHDKSENGEEEICVEQTKTDLGDHQIKKSKKKKKKHKIEDSVESGKTENSLVGTGDVNGNEEYNGKHKHKSKKKKKDRVELDVNISMEGTNVDKSSSRKRKPETEEVDDADDKLTVQKKKKKDKNEHILSNDLEETQNKIISDETVVKKKKKKKKNKIIQNSKDERNEEESNDTEVQNHKIFAEVNVDKEIKPLETERNTSGTDNQPITGQWNTASLGDEDRQNKFLRLLGGFKKGNNLSDAKSKFGVGNRQSSLFSGKNDSMLNTQGQAIRKGGNFAMNKTQAEDYVKNMERDYERAMSCNLNRGIGLGFQKQPDQGKKFYIDTNKSKSVKFEDSD